MREVGELVNAAEIRQLAAAPVVGEHVPGSVIDDPDFDFTLRYLYAFWRLCEQKIATSEPAAVNHAARTLAQRTGTDPDVRIIRMRSPTGEPTGGHRRVSWRHRWVVQMLIRNDLERSVTESHGEFFPSRHAVRRVAPLSGPFRLADRATTFPP